jgi:hypothetical protein
MARGAELVVGGCPPHTVYINISPKLVAHSQGWSRAWHEAFERTLYRVYVQVVSGVHNGHALDGQSNAMFGPAGRIDFCARCIGTRIIIDVSDFVGPRDPGPDGGTRQPRPTGDRVLGVNVSDKVFSFVTFYGPTLPGELVDISCRLRLSSVLRNAQRSANRSLPSGRLLPARTTICPPERAKTPFSVGSIGVNGRRNSCRNFALDGVFKPASGIKAKTQIILLPRARFDLRADAPRHFAMTGPSLLRRQGMSYVADMRHSKPDGSAISRLCSGRLRQLRNPPDHINVVGAVRDGKWSHNAEELPTCTPFDLDITSPLPRPLLGGAASGCGLSLGNWPPGSTADMQLQ